MLNIRNPKIRKIAGLFTGVAILGMALGAVIPALTDPGPAAPVGRAGMLHAQQQARAAYIESMKAQGYEILPAVQAADVVTPIQ